MHVQVTPLHTAKVYTKKELTLLETSIKEFYEKVNIPEIQKMAFILPNVHILGTHHYGEKSVIHLNVVEICMMFYADVLCPLDYEERLVSIFSHQIQS